ncbi:hypothetical protein GQ44DRAFT_710724 [Phaeosphaeriaceae sp. PMI808]|nr:hypothetical protein GQ44DRAFT_710724 [Phaeosphaeriaceae sp. PMI808]
MAITKYRNHNDCGRARRPLQHQSFSICLACEFPQLPIASPRPVPDHSIKLRVLKAFLQTSTTPSKDLHKTTTLFEPHISTSHTPLFEIDYNMHKSNSTYFSDLDISRSHLLLSRFRAGLSRLSKEYPEYLNVPCTIALGGASCTFRKAIPPLASYRMESRVLCWDRKWLYVATQFCATGENAKKGERVVYATALARYVVKAGGRKTVPPETLIEAAGLISSDAGSEQEEVKKRSEGALRYVQGFAAMDDLHVDFAIDG